MSNINEYLLHAISKGIKNKKYNLETNEAESHINFIVDSGWNNSIRLRLEINMFKYFEKNCLIFSKNFNSNYNEKFLCMSLILKVLELRYEVLSPTHDIYSSGICPNLFDYDLRLLQNCLT